MENIFGVDSNGLYARLDFGMGKREKSNMTERFLLQMSADKKV